MSDSLMIEAFNTTKSLAWYILHQRKNPLKSGISLSSTPKQENGGNDAETKLVVRPRAIKSRPDSSMPSDGDKKTNLKRNHMTMEVAENQPERSSRGTEAAIDWNENRNPLKGPLGRLLLWCNGWKEQQLQTVVKESTDIHIGMAELFLKIADRLIEILDYNGAPQWIKNNVDKVSQLKEIWRKELGSEESIFDDPEDFMESLETNISHIYEGGPVITAILLDVRDRERQAKRPKTSPVAQSPQNKSDPITAPETSSPQHHPRRHSREPVEETFPAHRRSTEKLQKPVFSRHLTPKPKKKSSKERSHPPLVHSYSDIKKDSKR